VYYFEPGAIQLDPTVVRSTLYEALQKNEVVTFEKTAVTGFERNEGGRFVAVITDRGRFSCDFVVNAAGPWSPSIFGSIDLSIPVSVEPVNVANWITSKRDLVTGMPIIADYVNLAYFRVWRDGEIHMHQPRRRSTRETARAFSENPLSITGADFVADPGNQALGYSQIKLYEDLARRRFNNIDSTVYGSGYRSYFDITPDLKFILGPDHRASNLIHCLGAGQSFKYAPVFGEVVADYVTGDGDYSSLADHFSIGRFDEAYMQRFWQQVRGVDNSLITEPASL
jgi:glycine/D-amino acid oxidase-like deaminating enzyme